MPNAVSKGEQLGSSPVRKAHDFGWLFYAWHWLDLLGGKSRGCDLPKSYMIYLEKILAEGKGVMVTQRSEEAGVQIHEPIDKSRLVRNRMLGGVGSGGYPINCELCIFLI